VAGYLLTALAIVGVPRLPPGQARAITGVAVASLALAVSSALPGVGAVFDALSGTALGAPFRESERYLAPYLLWLAVCAPKGAAHLGAQLPALAGGVVRAAPLALAALLVVPAAWGFGGQLRPVRFPPEWQEARQAVSAEPGPMISLPWFQYFSNDLAGDVVTLGIVPYYFGGDVITASDPRLTSEPRREIADPREPYIDAILERARRGEAPSEALARGGVRWIALQRDVDWEAYRGIAGDPGLTRVVTGPTLDLYRVDGWPGMVSIADASVPSDTWVSPLLSVDASDEAVLARGFQRGWLRGWDSSVQTREGLIHLPSGAGAVWFWPSVVVLFADAAVVAVAVACLASLLARSRRHSGNAV
jgi:hypothetical protein